MRRFVIKRGGIFRFYPGRRAALVCEQRAGGFRVPVRHPQYKRRNKDGRGEQQLLIIAGQRRNVQTFKRSNVPTSIPAA